jgi:tetratricopeptide (TPR) repeat protein
MLKNKVEEGAWAEALDLSSRALIARRKGTDAQALALALDRKATALQALGRAAEAEPLLREALAMHRTGSFEAGTATAHLASAVRAAGRPADAAPLLHEAIAAHEAALGADHPGTVRLDREAARLVTAYAATLAPDGGGEPLDEDEESHSTLAPPPVPPAPTRSGGASVPVGDTPSPIPIASTEAELRAAVAAADDDSALADASKRLASYYLHRGEARRAIAPARHVVELRAKLLGADNPNVAASTDFLGRCLGTAGEVREAESLLRRAVGGLARCLGMQPVSF